MTLQDQVTSLELSKRLKELGVKQDSLFYHVRISDTPDGRQDWLLRSSKWGDACIEEYSAFTVAELGEMLPSRYTIIHINPNREQRWDLSYKQNYWLDKSEAEARAKMLIYLLENKLIDLK
jgi:hypothetical protein